MPKPDDAALAAALRANLQRRKSRMRAARDGEADNGVSLMSGADEEGDVPPPPEGAKPGAWVSEGSKKL